ncbi:Type III secretion system substrate exporter, C-terminal [Acididesulfobacillus acetoxydans]|uniref:Flagellar biosynthetic protein FlhB n=1 Tax=Acididesulfobacillus acetoxydans TaxID=1561005 RepID=A0A8S0WQY9_9FIRM|nr:flagellar biosynthesis protein FlhB [Acididesulfobacillus acetoxydans]CAA7602954.1 Type III secretion system substrate exporter, C-terminal [Acididesulfobacillus acetoxydans]CEJ05836.1 Flagellar biosynthetic protein FlhB [Acididesulfobacillus acetoxydans]
MSEKQFTATPRRRQEARKKGQVLKSQELTSAVMLLGFVAVLKFWLPVMLQRLEVLFPYVWGADTHWNIHSVSGLMVNLLWASVQIAAPVFAAGAIIALAGNFLQVKTLFTSEPLKPDLARLNPVNGFKRMFGSKAWMELAKSLLKVIVIGYCLYVSVRDNLEVFPALQRLDVGQAAVFLGHAVLSLGWRISLSFLVLAVADYLYQRWDYEKNLRMSREELKEEFKQTEGSPQIRSEIKRRQRAMASRRMMQDLKKADVVVTNPTHISVALRYEPAEKSAPFVVAKGQDAVALRIREMAREYGITILENKPLARALYAQVDLGEAVPAELYKAVAEVLAFVYRLKRRR